MKIDLALLMSYLFQNPYKISKNFLIARHETEIYAYGETPLTSLEKIARSAKLTDRDVVLELGCGRGRTCFWLRSFIGCKVIGVDFIGTFIDKANQVKKKDKSQNKKESQDKVDSNEEKEKVWNEMDSNEEKDEAQEQKQR